MLEKFICFHLYKHLSTSDLLSNAQHGFRPGRSCQSLLLDSIHEWAKTVHEKDTTDVIFLDISKDFDTVSHTHLLTKLRRVGIDGWVLSWIKSYLSNRRQRCIVDGSVSDWLPYTSGVPQGSILGPLLFLIYIDDIAADLSSKVALFADDCIVFQSVHSREDQYLLQQDLHGQTG